MASPAMPPPGFRSRRWPVRAACLVGLLAVSGVVLRLAARIVGLPPGYNNAQTASARSLAAMDHWPALRRGTAKDILLFVPIYVIYGLAVMGVVSPDRRRLRMSSLLVTTMLGVGIADLAETLLFRRSLTRLIGGASASRIEGLTRATRAMTGLKLAFALATVVALAVRVLSWSAAPDVRQGRG